MDIKENKAKFLKDGFIFFSLNVKEDKYPTVPAATICQGVHRPCPKNMLEIKILNTPTKKPQFLFIFAEDKIIIGKKGLNFGTAITKHLPIVASEEKSDIWANWNVFIYLIVIILYTSNKRHRNVHIM